MNRGGSLENHDPTRGPRVRVIAPRRPLRNVLLLAVALAGFYFVAFPGGREDVPGSADLVEALETAETLKSALSADRRRPADAECELLTRRAAQAERRLARVRESGAATPQYLAHVTQRVGLIARYTSANCPGWLDAASRPEG
jgi:hypothetical protein